MKLTTFAFAASLMALMPAAVAGDASKDTKKTATDQSASQSDPKDTAKDLDSLEQGFRIPAADGDKKDKK